MNERKNVVFRCLKKTILSRIDVLIADLKPATVNYCWGQRKLTAAGTQRELTVIGTERELTCVGLIVKIRGGNEQK